MNNQVVSQFKENLILISSIGAFIIVFTTALIALWQRLRRKLKFIDCRIVPLEKIVISVEFIIKNKTLKSINVIEVGFKTKNDKEKFQVFNYPRGIEILPKEKKSIPSGTHSTNDVRAQILTENLKKKILFLYIKHNVGLDYTYRRIGFFRKRIKESGIYK